MVDVNYNRYILDTEKDANLVLEAMKDIINRFGSVTVGDLNELVGFPSTYKDQKIGWISLSEVKVLSEGNKFVIDLPRAEPIQ